MLQKQPRDLDEASKAATAVEYALNFGKEDAPNVGKEDQPSVHVVQTQHDDRIKELQTLIQRMSTRFDNVEAQLRVAKEETAPQDTRQGRSVQRPMSQRCYGCGQYGHWKQDCPLARKCYRCGEVGHFKRECPLKGKGPSGVGGQKVAEAELNHQLVYVCSGNSNLKVQGYLAKKPVCFLVDSGAAISVVCSDLLSGSQLQTAIRTSVGLEAIGVKWSSIEYLWSN